MFLFQSAKLRNFLICAIKSFVFFARQGSRTGPAKGFILGVRRAGRGYQHIVMPLTHSPMSAVARLPRGKAGGERAAARGAKEKRRPPYEWGSLLYGKAAAQRTGQVSSRRGGAGYTPVWPKPPAPRAVSPSSSQGCHSACSWRAMTICAMRSPSFTTKSSAEQLTMMTPISPR